MVILIISTASVAFAAEPQDANIRSQGCTGPVGTGWGVCGDEVTGLLGLTPEQICEQRQDGKSLAQIAESQGVSEEALVDAILTCRQDSLQQMVESGRLTQEQANLRLEVMEQNIVKAINRTAIGPPTDPEWRGCGPAGGKMMQRNMITNQQKELRTNQGFSGGEPGTGTGTGPGMMNRFGKASP